MISYLVPGLLTMDSSLFQSKVFVVTGAAAGIGLATASQLVQHGAQVHALDVVATAPESLTGLAGRQGHGGLTYHQVDVRSRARCHEIFEGIIAQHGQVDGIVNCAGTCPLEGELPGDDLYESCYDVNVRGTWIVGTEGLAQMKRQGFGSVVNIGSTSSLVGVARLPLYTSTKHAVLGLTRSWALDFAKYGVRVNMVAPGKLRTPDHKI
jgi:NAD(P)-dependent dehydrogenase (short-subunit alcohol dehydrogenase family)